jgi:hypothetical protein
MAADADDEYLQLSIAEAFIYKCGPRASSSGHKASDWTEQVAIVRLDVVSKGRDVLLKLFRADSGKLFAVCPLRRGGPPGIEPVTDSSRYFCLRLENDKGNHAFVGIGFNKREDAFDLKSSIADAQKQAEAEEKGVAGGGIDLGIGALGSDFSLREGQTLSVKIGGAGGGARAAGSAGLGAAPAAAKPAGAVAGAGAFKLRAPGAAGGAGPASPAPAPAEQAWESF